MNRIALAIYCFIFSLALGACSHDLPLLRIGHDPVVNRKEYLNYRPDSYRTFTVVPFTSLSNAWIVDTAVEHRYLQQLFYAIEDRGYRYVDHIDSADMIATVVVQNRKIRTGFLPNDEIPLCDVKFVWPIEDYQFSEPESLSIEPGTPIPAYVDSAGAGANVYLFLYDGRSRKIGLQIVGYGWYEDTDVVRMSEHILTRSSHWMNYRKSDYAKLHYGAGQIGAQLKYITTKVGNHWPSVESVVTDGPMDKAGVSKGDVIISIDNKSTRNMPLSRLLDRIKGPAGKTVNFEIWNSQSGTTPVLVTMAPR